MIEIIYNNRFLQLDSQLLIGGHFHQEIENKTGLAPSEYYLTQNGKRLGPDQLPPSETIPLRLVERLPAGKGGFGSMLRAIGAQIEKTTNREACRDLSGRRLRDINEEKRLKAYLDKQKEAPEDEAAKLQKKIDKLLAKPKHEFHDEEYNRTRSDLTQNVGDAVQEGFRKAIEAEREGVGKRKTEDGGKGKKKAKKAKGALWLGDDDLGSSSSDSDSDEGSDSACSSGAGSSSAGSSTAKQTVTSEDEKNVQGEKVDEAKPEVIPEKEVASA